MAAILSERSEGIERAVDDYAAARAAGIDVAAHENRIAELCLPILRWYWDDCPKFRDGVAEQASIALLAAIRTFDRSRGAKFMTWLGLCLKREIIDTIRQRNGRKSQKKSSGLRPIRLASFFTDLEYANDGSSRGPTRFDVAERSERTLQLPPLEDLVSLVPSKNSYQREAVARYFAGEVMLDVAKSLGVSESRISQLIGDWLERARASMGSLDDVEELIRRRIDARRSTMNSIADMSNVPQRPNLAAGVRLPVPQQHSGNQFQISPPLPVGSRPVGFDQIAASIEANVVEIEKRLCELDREGERLREELKKLRKMQSLARGESMRKTRRPAADGDPYREKVLNAVRTFAKGVRFASGTLAERCNLTTKAIRPSIKGLCDEGVLQREGVKAATRYWVAA